MDTEAKENDLLIGNNDVGTQEVPNVDVSYETVKETNVTIMKEEELQGFYQKRFPIVEVESSISEVSNIDGFAR